MSVLRLRALSQLSLRTRWAIVLIAIAACAAYWNSLSVPLNFDDDSSITWNTSIRRLWPLGPVLSPAPESNTAGRPLANLSFALNYALGGTQVSGYHVVNFTLHLGVALTLFGVVRRTLARLVPPRSADATSALHRDLARDATPLALAVAMIWTVHPLLPAAVTYLSQRTELLMAFFCLQTLLGFIRATEDLPDGAAPRRGWLAWSFFACAAGMASKESMVTAPVLVCCYDRVFVSGSFCQLWRERRSYYLALAATWGLLAWLLAGLASRNVGFGLGVSSWTYALAECEAVPTYLRLALWPHPLVFDYGAEMPGGVVAVAPHALSLLALLTATLIAIRRWPRAGFVAGAFFLILAPTSSVVPVALQPIAENRAYLPLAAVLILTVLAAYAVTRRRALVVLSALVPSLVLATAQRNALLADVPRMWREVIALRPLNARAWENYAAALCQLGRYPEAVPYVRKAIALNPGAAGGHRMLGDVLFNLQRMDEAIVEYGRALAINPRMAGTRVNLGVLLQLRGSTPEAIVEFQRALTYDPDHLDAHRNLVQAFLQLGRPDEAASHLARLHGTPADNAGLHASVANLLVAQNQPAAAAPCYEQALRLDPSSVPALVGLSTALIMLARHEEAATRCQEALRLKPDYVEARNNLAVALFKLGRASEAIAQLEQALQIKPDYADARRTLAEIRKMTPPSAPAPR